MLLQQIFQMHGISRSAVRLCILFIFGNINIHFLTVIINIMLTFFKKICFEIHFHSFLVLHLLSAVLQPKTHNGSDFLFFYYYWVGCTVFLIRWSFFWGESSISTLLTNMEHFLFTKHSMKWKNASGLHGGWLDNNA